MSAKNLIVVIFYLTVGVIDFWIPENKKCIWALPILNGAGSMLSNLLGQAFKISDPQ